MIKLLVLKTPSILCYIFHIKPHFSKRILIIFAPEEAEIFKDYLFILARFSVRLPLFSYDLKTIFFSDVKGVGMIRAEMA